MTERPRTTTAHFDNSLLRALLASLEAADLSLVKKLLAAAPATAFPPRALSLFEAIGVLNLEEPQSDLLAWLLDPQGPLTGSWLLQSMFQMAVPGEQWPGKPTVEREVAVENGRADIVVSWDNFRIVIENKVWSFEHNEQVSRYLTGFAIDSPEDGRIIFLTPAENWPPSIRVGDPRVIALGYRRLADLIDDGLASGKESAERGRVFAEEFRNGIRRLLKLRTDMTKPEISEGSRLLLGNAKKFELLKQQAIEESADFIDWLYYEAERRIKSILGKEMETLATRWGAYFRLPQWKSGEAYYGIAFVMGADPRKSLVAEHADQPCVCVAVFLADGAENKSASQPITDRLTPLLREVWPHAADLKNGYYAFPLYRYIPIPKDGNMDAWAGDVFDGLERLAKTLAPTLTQFSSTRPG